MLLQVCTLVLECVDIVAGVLGLKEHRRLYFHDGQWLREDHENQQNTESNSSSPMNLSDPESDNSFEGTGCMDYYSDSEGMELFRVQRMVFSSINL